MIALLGVWVLTVILPGGGLHWERIVLRDRPGGAAIEAPRGGAITIYPVGSLACYRVSAIGRKGRRGAMYGLYENPCGTAHAELFMGERK